MSVTPLLEEPPQTRGVLDQLAGIGQNMTLEVGRWRVPVTSLDRPLWPKARPRPATKRDLLRYLARIAPAMLPHLDGRPVFVTRWPEGVAGKSFYQKSWENPPPFVRTVSIWTQDSGVARDHLLGANLATLLWLGQQSALELHVWFSRVTRGFDGRGLGTGYASSQQSLLESRLNYPDFLVIDLDSYVYSGREAPGGEPELSRRGFDAVRHVAYEVRDVLETLELGAFVKTSGRTGLHLYVPIVRRFSFDDVRAIAQTLGEFLQTRCPDEVTLAWAVKDRTGKVFFDYNQNVRGKSLAAAYSPRRHRDATVSMPLRWDELPDAYPTDFTIFTAADLVANRGDPWGGILAAKADLELALGPAAATAASQ
jgi:bifunctional non-homologous end joining protein LigD